MTRKNREWYRTSAPAQAARSGAIPDGRQTLSPPCDRKQVAPHIRWHSTGKIDRVIYAGAMTAGGKMSVVILVEGVFLDEE
jgi:hypothetical protein